MVGRSLAAVLLLGAFITVVDGLPDKSSSRIGNARFDPHIKPEYDICILGGGTAASVLANRLSEDGKHSVIMVEAGMDPDDFEESHEYPGMNQFHLNGVGAPTNWGYISPSQPGWLNRTQAILRPLALGGSTVVNGMYLRMPSKQLLDSWETVFKNPQWNFETLSRTFKKATRFTGDSTKTNDPTFMSHDPQLYGDGPLEVGWQGWVPSTNAAYMKALSRVGINPVKDLNSGVVEGVAQGFMTVRQNWTRVTAYEAYVKPIRNERPNLTVLDRSYVERIIFDPKTEGTDELKAVGFTWHSAHSAIYHNTSCKLDVISSLGSIATPQLLMVSGIGPRDNLASVGVRTLIDMPQLASDVADHDSLSVVYRLKDEFGPGGSSQDLFHTESIQSEQELYFGSDKPYLSKMTATSGCTNGFGTYSNTTLRDIGAEEIHDIYSSGPAHVEHLYESQAYPGACAGYFTAEPNKSYISLTISNLVPTSKGTIRLGSSQMQASPIIDPHYFETKADIAMALQGIKDLRNISLDPGLNKFIAEEVGPGSHITSDEDLITYARSCAQPNWHWTQSCPMKPREEGGIVDPRLHVYGTKNLHICDSSIYPRIPDTNLMAPTYAVAEFCAELLLKEYSGRY